MGTKKETWHIEIWSDDQDNKSEYFRFLRTVDGKVIEVYGQKCNAAEAIVYATHIIVGAEPPRKISLMYEPCRCECKRPITR